MRFVSPLLKHAVYPALHHTGWLKRIPPLGGCAVVNYHGLLPADHSDADKFIDGTLVDSQTFRRHLRFLKAYHRVIHPEDFRASIEQQKPLPPRSVLVTCDDGLLNNLTDMLPILQSEDVPCLFFVTAASCSDDPGMLWYHELYYLMRGLTRTHALPGPALQLLLEGGAQPRSSQDLQSEWWSAIRRASQLDAEARANWMSRLRTHCEPPPAHSRERWRLMGTGELEQLSAAGMTIGAHTRTHPVLSLCSDEEARREIQESKIEIERVLGSPVWALAYPFGNPDTMGQREFRLAEEAGFSCAFLNVEHWREFGRESGPEPGGGNGAAEHPNPFALPRTHVTSDMTLPEYAAHLSGFHARLQRAVGA